MKYVLVDMTRGDMFTEEFEDKQNAIDYGDRMFSYKTKADKCTEYYLLESADPDEESEQHLNGDIIKRWL